MAQKEWRRITKLIDAAKEILLAEHPMTIRQLHYRLVSALITENCDRDYKLVSRIMTKARRDKRVDYGWITDRSRRTYVSGRGYRNLAEFAQGFEDRIGWYRRDYWQDQPNYVEVWTEKDAIIGSIEPVLTKYGIRAVAQRGFNSESFVWNIANRFQEQIEDGHAVHVLYLGDWDPSGEAIELDVQRRVQSVLDTPIDFDMQRVAILKRDIRDFKLPPLRVKTSDSRAPRFLRRHGDRAVELDALPPSELRARLERFIASYIDMDKWRRAKLVEDGERATCQQFAGVFRRMARKLGKAKVKVKP
jgi:hypothetical protein